MGAQLRECASIATACAGSAWLQMRALAALAHLKERAAAVPAPPAAGHGMRFPFQLLSCIMLCIGARTHHMLLQTRARALQTRARADAMCAARTCCRAVPDAAQAAGVGASLMCCMCAAAPPCASRHRCRLRWTHTHRSSSGRHGCCTRVASAAGGGADGGDACVQWSALTRRDVVSIICGDDAGCTSWLLLR
jgi:hypothetical protein